MEENQGYAQKNVGLNDYKHGNRQKKVMGSIPTVRQNTQQLKNTPYLDLPLSVCVCVCVLFVRYFYTMSADRHTAAHKQLVIN